MQHLNDQDLTAEERQLKAEQQQPDHTSQSAAR